MRTSLYVGVVGVSFKEVVTIGQARAFLDKYEFESGKIWGNNGLLITVPQNKEDEWTKQLEADPMIESACRIRV